VLETGFKVKKIFQHFKKGKKKFKIFTESGAGFRPGASLR
jgi:hypothetical protein